MMHPQGVLAMVAVFGTGVYLVRTMSHLYLRRLALRSIERASLPDALEQRLARIEQVVDAIAVEVERVSEGQRFTTRLLAERTTAGLVDRPRSGLTQS
jgi:hypothetical protein